MDNSLHRHLIPTFFRYLNSELGTFLGLGFFSPKICLALGFALSQALRCHRQQDLKSYLPEFCLVKLPPVSPLTTTVLEGVRTLWG